MSRRERRRLVWIILAAVVVVAAVAVIGPFVYIHFIEGPAPSKLELPKASGTTSTTASTRDTSAPTVSGVWNVGTGSVAGYRVSEVLIGQNSTAVGRTSKVWGSMTIEGTTVRKGTFSVDMASVVSDQSSRNARFDGPIMDVARFPTATLTLSSTVSLGSVPPVGVVRRYDAAGLLTVHGVTKSVSFAVSAERLGNEIDVLADISVPFSEWGITNPSIGGFVTTADTGTLEVLLHFTRGPGNPESTSSGASPSNGSGAPPTVPSTTVPPLTVPSR